MNFSKPFWNYLVHEARSKEAMESILQTRFKVGTNPVILKGVYTVPDIWYKGCFLGNDTCYPIKIFTSRTANYYDNGADRPMDTLLCRGDLDPEYVAFHKQLLKKQGYVLRSAEDAYNWLDNRKNHRQWASALQKWLADRDVDIFQNGGETIILNLSCIEKIEPFTKMMKESVLLNNLLGSWL
jgi:hypothetical protein